MLAGEIVRPGHRDFLFQHDPAVEVKAWRGSDNLKWVDKHKRVRSALGVSPGYNPWTEPQDGRPRPTLRGVPPNKRYVDTINLAWASRPPESRSLPFFVNFSQCPTRSPWGPHMKTLTTSSKVYDFKRDRVFTPFECLLFHGFPVNKLDFTMFEQTKLMDATGEMMSCPCLGSVLLGIYLNSNGPWWRRDPV
jgi:hypothetical protein